MEVEDEILRLTASTDGTLAQEYNIDLYFGLVNQQVIKILACIYITCTTFYYIWCKSTHKKAPSGFLCGFLNLFIRFTNYCSF